MASLDVVQDPGPAAAVDIVLVHGLEGDSESTWTYESTNLFWPRDLLPKDLPEARILVFSYPASLAYFFPETGDHDPTTTPGRHTVELRNALTRLQESTISKGRPVIFIAHGLGGLICAELTSICSSWGAQPRIKGIIFFSTPFGDGQDESWESIIRAYHTFLSANHSILPAYSSAGAAQSTDAQRIIQDFNAVTSARDDDDESSLRLVFLLPKHKIKDRDGNAVMMVEHDYAVLEGHDGAIIPGDQVSMTNFADGDSRGYRFICQSIQEWTEGAPKMAVDGFIGHWIHDTGGFMNNLGPTFEGIRGNTQFLS
ncbi:hypothetical protein BJX62DRAFT_242897 [Aspergillus germanicus]